MFYLFIRMLVYFENQCRKPEMDTDLITNVLFVCSICSTVSVLNICNFTYRAVFSLSVHYTVS